MRKGPGANPGLLRSIRGDDQRGVPPIVLGVVLIGSVDGVIDESVAVPFGIVLGDDIVPLRVLRRVERVVVVVDGVLMVESVDIVLLVLGDCIEPIVPDCVPVVPVCAPMVEPVPVEPPAVPPVVCADAMAGITSAAAANGIK